MTDKTLIARADAAPAALRAKRGCFNEARARTSRLVKAFLGLAAIVDMSIHPETETTAWRKGPPRFAPQSFFEIPT
jgi:hypothetical protein